MFEKAQNYTIQCRFSWCSSRCESRLHRHTRYQSSGLKQELGIAYSCFLVPSSASLGRIFDARLWTSLYTPRFRFHKALFPFSRLPSCDPLYGFRGIFVDHTKGVLVLAFVHMPKHISQ